MKRLDISGNPRIPVLVELTGSMRRHTEPAALFEEFFSTLRTAYGNRCYAMVSTEGLPPGSYRMLRMCTHDGRELARWTSAGGPVLSGGVIGAAISNGPQIIHDLDIRHDEALGEALAGFRSLISARVVANRFGIDWVIVLDARPDGFTERDLEELILRGNLVAAMIDNLAMARELALANERIRSEIERIGRIQRALLPESLPDIPGLRLAASYRTFDRAGGDFYDVSPLPGRPAGAANDGRWALLIGDVSGHGPAAAVVMAMFHAIFHTYPVRPGGPAEVLAHVNRHLCDKRIENSFVTAFLGFYDPGTRVLRYCRAGHEPPVLKDFTHRGAPRRLDAPGGLPLGIIPDANYTEAEATLRPGQTLILYTDGVIDARRPDGVPFGIEGIEDALVACSGEAQCAVNHIIGALEAHQLGQRPGDDQTVVAVQVTEEP